MAVDRVIGCVQVQNDVARGLGPESTEKKIDEHGLDRGRFMSDLMIAPSNIGRRMLQPVERALASERRRSGLIRLEAAQQGPEHGSCRRSSWSTRSPYPSARPKMRCPTRLLTRWVTKAGCRPSRKHDVNRSTSRMARSVAPSRSAPASEVTRPPSNAATSSRPPALPNSIPVALQCVGIGEHPPSGLNSFSQNKFYPVRDPDAPQSMRDAG